MQVMNYTDFRKNLADTLNKVNEDRTPILITRQSGEPSVLMSLKDFNAYEETAHLLSSPNNAKRLRESLSQARQGQVQTHDLIHDEI